jgi:hypothetical protein
MKKFTGLFLALSLLLVSVKLTPASAAPINSAPPTISGENIVDSTLRANRGNWSGTIENYIYQWRRCSDSVNVNTCIAIAGANSTSYKLTSSDAGKFIRFNVIAVDSSGGTTSVLSTSTLAIVAPPRNTIRPVISGSATIGNFVTTNSGTWSSPNQGVFRFRWYRCSSTVETSCIMISNANTSTYQVNDSDIGKSIRSEVTVFDITGKVSSSIKSSGTDFVASLPKNTSAPSISGSPTTGVTLTGLSGVWLAYPEAAITNQWQRCSSLNSQTCQDIIGEKSSIYTTTLADLNQYFRLSVTSVNNLGGTIKFSSIFGPILQQVKPQNSQAPSLSGFAIEGGTLTIAEGSWSGLPSPSYTYKWFVCEVINSCVEITGANEKSLKIELAFGNRYLKARVLATNLQGTSEAETATLYVDSLLKALIKPNLSGKLAVGGTIISTNGTWSQSGNYNYEYKWQRCANSNILSCETISDLGPSYRIKIDDFGKLLRAGVAVSGKSSFAYSEMTPVISNTLNPKKN